MNHPEVAGLYKVVIDDVVKNVRVDFLNMGIDEQVLFELQDVWERKLLETKVLANFDPTAQHQQPNTALIPMPQHSLHHLPMHSMSSQAGNNVSLSYPSSFVGMTPEQAAAHQQQLYGGAPGGVRLGYYGSYFGQQTSHVQIPASGAAANLATLANPHYVDYQQLQRQQIQQNQNTNSPNRGPGTNPPQPNRTTRLPQVDGTFDQDAMLRIMNSNSKVKMFPVQVDGSPSESSGTPEEIKTETPLEEDILGSDLDDEDDDNDASIETYNIILCQYEKATRTKSKWRCSLKDGLMHLHGIDYAFHRASGEFEWI